MAEFKKISETEVIETLQENDNLVLVSDGVVKQVSTDSLTAAELKKISETEIVEAREENDTLLLVSNGEVKQIPVEKFAEGGADWNASEDEPGYVANRTHGRKINVTEFPETEVLFENESTPFCACMVPFAVNVSIGDRVDVTLDGNTFVCVVKHNDEDMFYVGNPSIIGMPDTSNEPFVAILVDEGFIVGISDTENLAHTLAIRHYSEIVQKLDNIYLQDDVTKYGAIGEVTRIEWDGNTEGLDTFEYNGYNFYKVSDTAIPFAHLSKAYSKSTSDDEVMADMYLGTNCYELAFATVVTKSGTCVNSYGLSFNAPSIGTYFMSWNSGNSGDAYRCEYVEFDTRRENSILYLTDACGVKHEITMDDNGNLATDNSSSSLIITPDEWQDSDFTANIPFNDAINAMHAGRPIYLYVNGDYIIASSGNESNIRFTRIYFGGSYMHVLEYFWQASNNMIYRETNGSFTLQSGGVE